MFANEKDSENLWIQQTNKNGLTKTGFEPLTLLEQCKWLLALDHKPREQIERKNDRVNVM